MINVKKEKSCNNCMSRPVCTRYDEVEEWIKALNWDFLHPDWCSGINDEDPLYKDLLIFIGSHCRYYSNSPKPVKKFKNPSIPDNANCRLDSFSVIATDDGELMVKITGLALSRDLHNTLVFRYLVSPKIYDYIWNIFDKNLVIKYSELKPYIYDGEDVE